MGSRWGDPIENLAASGTGPHPIVPSRSADLAFSGRMHGAQIGICWTFGRFGGVGVARARRSIRAAGREPGCAGPYFGSAMFPLELARIGRSFGALPLLYPPLLGTPRLRAIAILPPCQSYWMNEEVQIGVLPDCPRQTGQDR